MDSIGSRRGANYASGSGSTINQKAVLASAYQELGKELSSAKLKMVGNYTLQRPIGEGTFGKVRLGLHRLTNTRVAIKQIPKAHSASLTREIHHHRRLHHPNVMQLYEVIATEGYIWMVSELCAGGELYDYLVEHEVLGEPEARRIFGQLCLAVAYIHSKGIVHRDLKLENILLDERCNVKLGDFGFTREFEGRRLMETFCGTTGYASPEMLACKKYTGEEVDIWSLGVILYALLCGALPFDDDDESVMKAKILKGDYEIPECLSEEAQDLIRLILQQDPNARPSIKAILAHPWFTKLMVHTPMSTVEEDELPNGDYFTSRSQPGTAATEASHRETDAETQESNGTLLAVQTMQTTTGETPMSNHQINLSSASESSYHSARSDSESSDRRSSTTDLTDPTTADSTSRAGDLVGSLPAFMPSPAPADAGQSTASAVSSTKHHFGMHRNESQTTIKRTGSNGSDASFGAGSSAAGPRAPTRSTSMSLPTHHELPNNNESSQDDEPLAMPNAVPLSKRGSQSSSRGHHRTPSRTKRRSLSSGGISDHQPPLLGRKPVDYISQLASFQPATFSTAVEQSLLHQLSSLGIDVGQMVHSVVNDACDASGAMWWMLLRKSQEKNATQFPHNLTDPASVPTPTTTSVPTTAPPSMMTTPTDNLVSSTSSTDLASVEPPPPIPQKDPSRRSEDRRRGSLTASRSENSGLTDAGGRRLHTVVSHEELDLHAASMPVSASLSDLRTHSAMLNGTRASMSQSSSLNALASSSSLSSMGTDRLTAGSPDSDSPRPKSQHRHTTTPSSTTNTPSKLRNVSAASPEPSTPESSSGSKSKRNPRADRQRSNSLSVKQFAQNVLGTKDKDKERASPPEQVIVAGEALPVERAKSPTIFGRRNTVGAKELLSARISSPSTPKKSLDAALLDRARKSAGKKSMETDLDRIKGLEQSVDSANSSPSRSVMVSTPSSIAAASTLAIADDTRDTTPATPTTSQESFSTLSMTPQGSEKNASKSKSGSSFMATVRTWLGANEKTGRKTKGVKKSPAAHRIGLGLEAKSPTSVHTTPVGGASRTPSVRRRSAHYQQASGGRRAGPRSPHMTSVSRRSSTGSSHHLVMDIPPSSLQQSLTRPGNLRRMSAGSITPTATMYGEHVQDYYMASSARQSRPSSSHSHAHSVNALRPGLHGKAGSTGSTSSALRPGVAGSTYSSGSGRRHARRPSHDGGTTVRRHRTYASSTGSPSRRSSMHQSRPSSIRSRASSPGRGVSGFTELDGEDHEADESGTTGRTVGSVRSTPRHSLDYRPNDGRRSSIISASGGGAASGRTSPAQAHNPQHHHVVTQSIFVAHKSRSPYKPPSANPNLHGSMSRASHGAHHSHGSASGLPSGGASGAAGGTAASAANPPTLSSTGLPAVGTGTWRHSWGRPPPCWAGPVDPPPAPRDTEGTYPGAGGPGRPKLRDVFAKKDDDDWTDEEDEPLYSGGLGQLDSLSLLTSSSAGSRNGAGSSGTITSSPYATRNFAALGGAGAAGYGSMSSLGRGAGAGANASASATGSGFSGPSAFSSRYAGVRGIFGQQQPPYSSSAFSSSSLSGGHYRAPLSLSLGNEFAPKVLSSTLHSPTNAAGSGSGALGMQTHSLNGAASGADSLVNTAGDSSHHHQQQQQQQQLPSLPIQTPQQGSRITATFNKPVQIIEEDEEEDE
ncbi:Pkinase-domain-containing protein [Testicularia cyperi]|uniref:non-specific serine/threonine protein kinase n=1 Tax=Testicularia cyperi TaxID=1882483 RepID=A0A317XWY5_9BASI|nr:Pkinase-domain-containing protein [Testicularia cyperi]